jgi:CCR4-NOT transcription complex subunit 1
MLGGLLAASVNTTPAQRRQRCPAPAAHRAAALPCRRRRAITQTNERTLIKQLGTWLGLLTFAKNKPILSKDMDFKAMITDAYQRGRMIAVLPFVQKVRALLLPGCHECALP